MTSVSRLRSNSEVLPGARLEYRNWVSEAFQQYQLPTLLGQDTVDPADGHTHRFQSRFLGLSSLKLGACCFSNTAFYEITESEISEIAFTDSADESPECADVLLSLSESPVNDSLAAFPSLLCTGRSPMALPPKKRKRRRVIRYDVVFCILDEPQECQVPSPDREYFLFPRDAVVEAVNDVSPFEVLFSFHLPKSSESSAAISTLHAICSCAATQPKYESKLEEFAAVCSSHSFRSRNLSQRRFTDPGLQMPSVWKTESHVLNMQISGVSRDLYIAVKQTVSGFEAVCQRMMDLVRLHTERVASEKELVKEEMSLTKMEVQSQDDDMYDKHSWSSDENSWDKESNVFDDDTTMDIYMDSPHSKQQSSPPSTTVSAPAGSSKQSRPNGTNGSLKKCLYCGSKSTPMWRRGPQGAGTLCNACGVKWKHGKILCGTDAAQSMPVRDQQRRNSKPEKRRKKGATTKKDKRAKIKDKKRSLTMESEDEEMLKSIDAARNLSLNDRGRSLSSAAANSYNVAASSKEQGNASSYSVSDSCSPLDSSPNSSPPLLVHDQDRTRQSLDISIIETIGFSTESVTMSAGVDAVEAAAVLTLLKRGQD